MAVPVVTSASVVQTPNSGGTSATLNIPISASGNDRLVFVAGVSKDNSSTVNVLSTMVFDATGVNLSVGAGIAQVTTRQIAQEGNFSSQSDVYVIKEADLPSSAGTYAIDITMDGTMQYLYWIAFEVTGCNQTLDATAVASGVSNVSAGGSYSLNSTGMTPGTLITTTVADCLLIDFWGQSDSAAPGISPGTGQIQIGSNFSNTNGGGNCSYKAATTVGSYNMSQTTTTLSQRQAGIVVSIAPASGGTLYTKTNTGSLTPSGALSNSVIIALAIAGAIAMTGSLSKLIRVTLSGSVAAIGVVTKKTSRALAGSITAAGALAKKIFMPLSGSITGSGVLSTLAVVKQATAGSITATGSVLKKIKKSLAGTVSAVGALPKNTATTVAGTIAMTGSLVKKIFTTKTGSITPSGALSARTVIKQAVAGVVNMVGTVIGVIVIITVSAGARVRRLLYKMLGRG